MNITIHVRNQTKESQDWVYILENMYTKWAKLHNFNVVKVEKGLKIEGGVRLLSENGIHRLCRISPYDIVGRRHTTFANVSVWSETIKPINKQIIIRSYTLDPYKIVKDYQSGLETEDVQNILNGYLDNFMENTK